MAAINDNNCKFAIMIKKIVISPSNKGAISFLNDIAKRKAEIIRRLEAKGAKRLAIENNG